MKFDIIFRLHDPVKEQKKVLLRSDIFQCVAIHLAANCSLSTVVPLLILDFRLERLLYNINLDTGSPVPNRRRKGNRFRKKPLQILVNPMFRKSCLRFCCAHVHTRQIKF